MKLKGAIEVEVLKDTSQADGLAKGRRRYATMVMDEKEQKLYCESPNAARSNEHPGFPDPTYD